jgi:two-component system phosphate regulon sensor histidine kinase PhoR
MNIQNLGKLAALIKRERAQLLLQWREQVRLLPSAKHLDTPSLNDHVPPLLDELATAFQQAAEKAIPKSLIQGSPPLHGLHRYHDGFDMVEVVTEYNILRACIHDLAESHGLSLQGKAFHILNRVFDEAIGLAIQTFSTQQALNLQRRRDEYLAFVAHDLRAPLNAIALVSRILELEQAEQKEGTSETSPMLKTLRRNVQQLETLVERVLKESAHVQTEAGIRLERRSVDLWPLVESVIHDLLPVTEPTSTQVINQIPEELITLADASLLRRIFQNLITNAVQYAPRGEVVIGARERDDAIECWVSDNGSGIPEDRLEKIFDKLETDPEKKPEGTGLGLAIVKTFVEAHGGKVTVETKEGDGSTFRFTIPKPKPAPSNR